MIGKTELWLISSIIVRSITIARISGNYVQDKLLKSDPNVAKNAFLKNAFCCLHKTTYMQYAITVFPASSLQ